MGEFSVGEVVRDGLMSHFLGAKWLESENNGRDSLTSINPPGQLFGVPLSETDHCGFTSRLYG